jgi:ferredoxin-type protein NapF
LAVRPPWARPLSEFESLCTRCALCVAACPEKIIVIGAGELPAVDFQLGACTFCGACADACTPGALTRRLPAAWIPDVEIGDGCLAKQGVYCEICRDACEPRAIVFMRRPGCVPLPSIHLSACTGCGACVATCPVSAIAVQNQPPRVSP